jgi:cytochrome c5
MSIPVHSETRSSLVTMQERLVTAIVLAFAASLTPQAAIGQSGERSGKQVVDQVCAACHRTGAHGAPKIGDKKGWAPRASKGLSSLTQSALKGIREMPPHGGNFQLSDTEIERGITYMVNRSGGHWAEPVSPKAPAAERSGEKIVKMQCIKCHGSGVGGAPKLGDREAWTARVKPGIDVLVRSAINGHGGMPARGGMGNLTDPEIKNAVIYMATRSIAPSKAP